MADVNVSVPASRNAEGRLRRNFGAAAILYRRSRSILRASYATIIGNSYGLRPPNSTATYVQAVSNSVISCRHGHAIVPSAKARGNGLRESSQKVANCGNRFIGFMADYIGYGYASIGRISRHTSRSCGISHKGG